MVLVQIFSKWFGSPAISHSTDCSTLSIIIHHPVSLAPPPTVNIVLLWDTVNYYRNRQFTDLIYLSNYRILAKVNVLTTEVWQSPGLINCCKEWMSPPLWSSGQSSWLQIRRPGFDSRHYQREKKVVGLERGPLSLVSTTEELLERIVAAPV
jgi:hypothetical protein